MIEPQPTEPPPTPPFQFTLRTLLLLFVVLGSSLAVFGGWGIVVFALVVGLAAYLRRAQRLVSWGLFAFIVPFVAFALGCLFSALDVPRESSRRAGCASKLHEIAKALEFYYSKHDSFPPAYLAGKDGKPTHSWRVLLLPFVEYDALYRQFDLNQPWDAPGNRNPAAAPLREFLCPNESGPGPSGSTPTSYLAVVGPGAAWQGEKPRRLADFGGKAAETIMVVESLKSGIRWAEPRDIALGSHAAVYPDLATMLAPAHPGGRDAHFLFIYYYAPGVHVIMADGKVRMLDTEGLTSEDLGKILQIGGCAEDTLGRRVLFDDCETAVNWPNIAALAVWLASVGTLLVGAVRGRKARPPASPPG